MCARMYACAPCAYKVCRRKSEKAVDPLEVYMDAGNWTQSSSGAVSTLSYCAVSLAPETVA